MCKTCALDARWLGAGPQNRRYPLSPGECVCAGFAGGVVEAEEELVEGRMPSADLGTLSAGASGGSGGGTAEALLNVGWDTPSLPRGSEAGVTYT